MAVNKMRNGEVCRKISQNHLSPPRRDSETSCVDFDRDDGSKGFKQSKKDVKKPELQRYRPGMGLRQRNNAKGDESVSTSLQKINITDDAQSFSINEEVAKDYIEKINENLSLKDSNYNSLTKKLETNSVYKKNNKNRRPDQQVYMPKSRIAAKLKGLIDEPAEKSEAGAIDTNTKSHDKELNREPEKSNVSQVNIISVTSNMNLSSKKSQIEKPVNNHRKQPSPKYTHNSSIKKDLDLYSDSSDCRSTPEGFDSEKGPLLTESLNFVNSNLKHDPAIRKLSGDFTNKHANSKGESSTHGKASHSNYICWGDTEFEADCDGSDYSESQDMKQETFLRNAMPEETRDRNNKAKSKSEDTVTSTGWHQHRNPDVLTNGVMEVGKNAKNRIKQQGRERKLSEKDECASKSKTSNPTEKNNRKAKRDKNEQSLPPRFQKQNQNAHPERMNNSADARGGGILVVPTNALTIKPPRHPDKNNSYGLSPLQPSPPQMFVHKQLFNPKNPSNPEIVNVPAPVNPSHFDPPHFNPDYIHGTDIEYRPGPMPMLLKADEGYIPPPQPPAVKTNLYQYPNLDFPPLTDFRKNNVIGSIAPPVLCPLTTVRMLGPPVQPPVFHNDYIMPPEAERKRLKPIVEKNLKEISLLERELTAHLAKGVSTADLNALRQCRWKLQLRYENIILADPRYCAEKNAEQHLWKSAYYQIIEALRKNLEEQPQNKELKDNLLNLVHEGAVFYENLLEKLQETYGFNLTQLLESDNLNGSCFPESLRLVLISSQKILIYLGDLARYKEQAGGTTNFGKARSWYLKAQQIAPKNGRPCHQLAILALCARRKLDAVYYFIRSLAASNPFLSAREYLLNLFEDAKKRYERTEKKRQDDLASEKEIIAADSEERSEVWIKPDGTSSQHPTVLEEDRDAAEFQKLSNVELNKRFVNSFLHVHGKLYTKVGMEFFNEILIQMLREFNYLLQRVPLVLESSRLLQLSAINMYAVANATIRDSNYEEDGYPLLLIQALQVSQAMMSLVIQRCCALHKLHILSPEYPKQLISYDVGQLLPAVKTWTDWMSCQQELWTQLSMFPSELPDIGLELDVWSSFADFLTILTQIDTSSPGITFERKEGFEPIVLEEDSLMSGFVPLLGALHDPAYAMPPFDKDRAKQCVRISRIQYFGDYLCGIPTPYLEFDVERKKFISLVTTHSENEGSKTRKDLLENHKDDSFGDESLESDDVLLQSPPDDEGNSEIKMLWSRKEALSKVKARQEKYQAQVQAVLQKNQRQRPIVLQIQPRYLVPDTNCFIDHLQHLKNILEMDTFHLVVPLVVINELDGLARGTRPNPHSTPEHANKVTVLSRASVAFLEEQFASRNPRLRSITSKGSVLDTISFRVEEMGHNKRGNNDDLILSCCLYYCKDRAEIYMPKNQDGPLQLMREVVLLTDDRNLRVKALTHNVPARDLMSFLQWVNS